MTQIGPQIRRPLEPLRIRELQDMVQPGPEADVDALELEGILAGLSPQELAQGLQEMVAEMAALAAPHPPQPTVDRVKKKEEAAQRFASRGAVIITVAEVAAFALGAIMRPCGEEASGWSWMQGVLVSKISLGIALAGCTGMWLSYKLFAREVKAIDEA